MDSVAVVSSGDASQSTSAEPAAGEDTRSSEKLWSDLTCRKTTDSFKNWTPLPLEIYYIAISRNNASVFTIVRFIESIIELINLIIKMLIFLNL